MGWFSSKKKTVVDTQITRVVEDEHVTDSIQNATIKAILEGGSIPEYIMDEMLHGTTRKFERMYRYARDEYSEGLPQEAVGGLGQREYSDDGTSSPSSAEKVIDQIIADLFGTDITVTYKKLDTKNAIHHARQHLVDELDYHETSNEIRVLSTQKGSDVYLENMFPFVDPTTLETSGPGAATNWDVPATGGQTEERTRNMSRAQSPMVESTVENPLEGIQVVYSWWTTEEVEPADPNDPNSEPVTERVKHVDRMFLDMTGHSYEDTYLHVKYYDAAGRALYWRYKTGSGTYPDLDNEISHMNVAGNSADRDGGTYWPFVFFRGGKTDLTSDARKDTELYKTSSKLLEYAGMDYGAIGAKIHENEDIADVEQAMMLWGVPAESFNPTDRKYLFLYFKDLITRFGERERRFSEGGIFSNADRMAYLALGTRDFGMLLSLSEMRSGVKQGKVTEVGNYTATYSVRQSLFKFDIVTAPSDPTYAVDVPSVETREFTQPEEEFHFFYQIDEETYEEIEVDGLTTTYNIYKQYGVNAEAGDSRLLIPLDKRICDLMSIKQKEELYLRSMHFAFNSRVTVKIKWYQSGVFKWVLTIAAIVITVYTGVPAFTAMAATLATAGVTAFMWAVAVTVVKVLAVQLAYKLTVKALGEEFAMILAVAVMLYGGYRAFSAGGLQNAPFATDLIQASTGLANAAASSYQDKLGALQDSAEDFRQLQEESWARLEEANELLEQDPSLINPLIFVAGEKAEEFYQRTIHSGNIGVTAYDMLHKHVDLTLRLPTLHDTLGDKFNG